MKLNDFDKKNPAKTALKENFNYNFDASRLNKSATQVMLKKISTALREAKTDPNFNRSYQKNPSYLKLVFMEQALKRHQAELNRGFKRSRIVVENVEVEKSQVILAAQDMVNNLQKMVEQVNDMMVKELPAMITSIENEIGVSQSQEFNTAASQALAPVNQALMQSTEQMRNALNILTGQEGAPADFGVGPNVPQQQQMPGAEEQVPELPAEEEPGVELPAEEEPEEVGPAGRARR